MQHFPGFPQNIRLGFHYFPDALHYRDSDLETWLPELKALGAAWLTLRAPIERAIPEAFIRGLQDAKIEPILHFHLPLGFQYKIDSLSLMFQLYARWGVHYAALFDRPNDRTAWAPSAWAQADLVERFLDIYLPLAEQVVDAGLTPVFPPLEPGGDFWDTAFLRLALRGMKRRGHTRLIESLVLGAYAWAGNCPLDWGAGGPERWPEARPYQKSEFIEDQRGFRIFDWYLPMAQAELGCTRPILLLGAGSRPGDQTDPHSPAVDRSAHAHRNLAIARLAASDWDARPPTTQGEPALPDLYKTAPLEPMPPEVLACNFWLLAAAPGDACAPHAWFQPDGTVLPAVGALRQWYAGLRRSTEAPTRPAPAQMEIEGRKGLPSGPFPPLRGETHPHPIAHYLLLPLYAWGAADWDLEFARPFIQEFHPTVGFSVEEASMASRVTLAGSEFAFPEDTVARLEAAGCVVERLEQPNGPSGTEVAPVE